MPILYLPVTVNLHDNPRCTDGETESRGGRAPESPCSTRPPRGGDPGPSGHRGKQPRPPGGHRPPTCRYSVKKDPSSVFSSCLRAGRDTTVSGSRTQRPRGGDKGTGWAAGGRPVPPAPALWGLGGPQASSAFSCGSLHTRRHLPRLPGGRAPLTFSGRPPPPPGRAGPPPLGSPLLPPARPRSSPPRTLGTLSSRCRC